MTGVKDRAKGRSIVVENFTMIVVLGRLTKKLFVLGRSSKILLTTIMVLN